MTPQTSNPDTLHHPPPAGGTKRRLLLVEDEPYVRESLGRLLEERGYAVTLADGVGSALEILGQIKVDLVLTDLKLPGGGGLEMTRRARAISKAPVVVLTGFGSVTSAVECLKAGASDYLLKPAEPEALELAFERALRLAAREGPRAPEPADLEDTAPVGASASWLAVVEMLRFAASAEAPVLLLGESGTGKEMLARLLHRLGPRASGPFVAVNCAAVPLEVWESEFFGHRKGAFTGAVADRLGRFPAADGGTLFLDEVGAMPYEGQAKLLRAIQEGEAHRLGDDQPTRFDVRIVAATNGDLGLAVRSRRFREDLFHRLNVLRIELPPLRSRPEDVALLARHFVDRIAARLGRTPPPLPEGALEKLRAHSWPGNVRELASVLERAMVLDPEGGLASLDLTVATPDAAGDPPAARDLALRTALGRLERSILVEALQRSNGVRKRAARLLGIDQRNLAYYLHKHRVNPDHPV